MFNGVNFIRDICKQRGIAISALEKECGFSNGYLNPKKLTRIPYDRALKIAKYLNLDVNYIMTGKNDDEKDESQSYYLDAETAKKAQEMYEDEDMRTLFDMKKNISPEIFETHMKFMKELYNKEHPSDE